MVRCIIAEDDPAYTQLLKEQLARAGGVEVLTSVKDTKQAIVACKKHQPDVLILDHRMPDGTGFAMLPQIRESSPKTRIILHSAFADSEVRRMDPAGQTQIVGKDQPFEALVAAVKGGRARPGRDGAKGKK